MRGKWLAAFLTVGVAAAGLGAGAALMKKTAKPVQKTAVTSRETMQGFVQAANAWLTARQKTSAVTFFMADKENGWRTDGRKIYRTSNGGRTWETAAAFSDGQSARFVSADEAFTLADFTYQDEELTGLSVFATADKGNSWRRTALPKTFLSSDFLRGADAFAMADRKNGLLFLAGDEAAGSHESSVLATADGGLSWQQAAEGVRIPGGQVTLACADASHAYLFVNNAASPVFMLASQDGGKTWNEQDAGISARYTDVAPTYLPVRMTSSERVVLFSTQNGRKTSSSGNGGETADSHMRNVFCTLTPDGAVEKTLAQLVTDMPLDARSVSMPDADTIFAFAGTGKTSALYRFTRKQGWKRVVSSALPAQALQVQFLDQNDGFLLQSGAFFTTADGGKTWNRFSL